MSQEPHKIRVEVRPATSTSSRAPSEQRYVFSYTITIRNEGQRAAKLLTRHWIITDANGRVKEVRGEGVVGEQPHLEPGQGFRYSSGAVLETPVGTMQGSYQMVDADGTALRCAHRPFPARDSRNPAVSRLCHRRHPGLLRRAAGAARRGSASPPIATGCGSSATW